MAQSELTRDDLLVNGYHLLQKRDGYRFSLDAVLLASFPTLKAGERVLDLGCGSGVLPLLLLGRERELRITGLELLADVCALARRNMAENQADVNVVCGDMRECGDYFEAHSFDLIVTNPPFYPGPCCRPPQNGEIAIAKTERCWDQERLMAMAAKLLKDDGRLALIFDAGRAGEIIALAVAAGFFLERRRVVCFRAGESPRRVLLQWGKRPGIVLEEDALTIYEKDGAYAPSMKRILENYHGTGTVSGGDAHR